MKNRFVVLQSPAVNPTAFVDGSHNAENRYNITDRNYYSQGCIDPEQTGTVSCCRGTVSMQTVLWSSKKCDYAAFKRNHADMTAVIFLPFLPSG